MGGEAPILFWFIVACRPQVWSVHCSGAPVRARPPVATPAGAGGFGALGRGVRVQLRSPPGVAVPSGGGGTSPPPRGGRGPASPRLAGRGGSEGERGGKGGRAAAPRPSALLGGPRPPSLSPCVSGAPPSGIHVQFGLPGGRGRLAHPDRPPVGQCGGGGGGGRDLLDPVCAPAFPRPASEWAASFSTSWVPPFCCRSVAGNAGVCRRSIGGAWRVAPLAAAGVCPPRVRRPPRGGAGPLSLRLVPVCPWAGGGGGREGGVPWSPDAAP